MVFYEACKIYLCESLGQIKGTKYLNDKKIFLHSAAPNSFHPWTNARLGSTVRHLETLFPAPIFLPALSEFRLDWAHVPVLSIFYTADCSSPGHSFLSLPVELVTRQHQFPQNIT